MSRIWRVGVDVRRPKQAIFATEDMAEVLVATMRSFAVLGSRRIGLVEI